MSTSELRKMRLASGTTRTGPVAGLPILVVWAVVLGCCVAFWAGVGILLANLI